MQVHILGSEENTKLCFLSFQGYAVLPVGFGFSTQGNAVIYEQAIAWKVVDNNNADYGIAFMFVNWFLA